LFAYIPTIEPLSSKVTWNAGRNASILCGDGRPSAQTSPLCHRYEACACASSARSSWNNCDPAQVPKSQKKPTELVIRRYEEFIADGSLLRPEGWKRASELFAESDAYSPSGEIWVVSTGGLVGEDWVKRDRAQAETKWNDSFDTIDSSLGLKPPDPERQHHDG
jgi:hypothetical protein